MGRGRPRKPKKRGPKEKYRREFDDQARVACSEGGFTDLALAKLFGVCRKTIFNWMAEHPSFAMAREEGKAAYGDWKSEKEQQAKKEALKSAIKLVKGYRFTETTKEAAPVYEITLEPDEKTGEFKQVRKLVGSEMAVTKKVSKHISPNASVIALVLKCLDNWTEKQHLDIETPADSNIVVNFITPDGSKDTE